MRWANVQAIDVKFSQNLIHQNHKNRLIFEKSYLTNEKVDVFGTQCIAVSPAAIAATARRAAKRCKCQNPIRYDEF